MKTDEELTDDTLALAAILNEAVPNGTPNGIVLAALATLLGGGIRLAPPEEKEIVLREHIKIIKQMARLPLPGAEDLH